MTYDEFNDYCDHLPATTYVQQWGGAHVWKVGGKVFAIGGWGDDRPAFTFKADAAAYGTLCDQPGLRPAPYFASRGMKWIQHYTRPGPSDTLLKELVRESHHIVSLGLTKRMQKQLGLDQAN